MGSRTHALVVAWRKDQLRERFSMIPPAVIRAGNCISCGDECFVNELGASALRERDADVVCPICESRYEADINRAMIPS